MQVFKGIEFDTFNFVCFLGGFIMELNGVQQVAYNEYVHALFQSMGGLLDGTCRERPGVIGTTDQYRVSNQVVATQKSPQDALTVLNMRFDPVTATLANWSAPDFVNIFEQTDVNFPIAREIAQGIVKAVKRRSDQMKIDALDASTTTNTIAEGGTGFTFTKLKKLLSSLQKMQRVVVEFIVQSVRLANKIYWLLSSSLTCSM